MITHPISLYAADAQIVKSYVEDGRWKMYTNPKYDKTRE